MRTKHKLLLYSFLFFMALSFIPTSNMLAQGFRDEPIIPFDPEAPIGDRWQEGYDYGFRLGKSYATSGNKETIWVYGGIINDANNGSVKMVFIKVTRTMPLSDYYEGMNRAFNQAKINNSSDYDIVRYFEGALQGLYDGYWFNIDTGVKPSLP